MADTRSWDVGQQRGAYGAAVDVTPSDSAGLVDSNSNSFVSNALYIGGSGSGGLKVDMAEGPTGITFAGLTAPFLLPIRVTKVYATGTNVTNIVALK